MLEFRTESSLDGNYLIADLESQDAVDEIAVRVLRKDCPDFLIPFTLSNRNDRPALRYRLTEATSLQYLDLQVTTDGFVKLYLKLLAPFIQGKDWFLDYHSLCVDPGYVYFNNRTREIQYIYVPSVNYRNSESDILNFLKNFMNNVHVTDAGDFVVSVYRYFAGPAVTLSGLYSLFRTQDDLRRKDFGGFAGDASPSGGRGPIGTAPGSAPSGAVVPEYPGVSDGAATGRAGTMGAFPGENQGGHIANEASSSASNEEGKKGRGGLFGGGKKEKKTARGKETTAAGSDGAEGLFGEAASSFTSDENAFLDDLLSNDKKSRKKSKDKGKGKDAAGARAAGSSKKTGSKSGSPLDGFFKGSKSRKSTEGNPSADRAADADGADIFRDSHSAGPQGSRSSAGQPVMEGAVYSTYPMGESDETEISGASRGGVHRYMELIDSALPGAMQRIDLEFPGNHILIGRISSNEQRPDVAFPAEFRRIGRRHARIERTGEDLYLIDLGSLNYTFVNGQKLIPNQPCRLTNGAIVVFTEQQPVRYRVHC